MEVEGNIWFYSYLELPCRTEGLTDRRG